MSETQEDFEEIKSNNLSSKINKIIGLIIKKTSSKVFHLVTGNEMKNVYGVNSIHADSMQNEQIQEEIVNQKQLLENIGVVAYNPEYSLSDIFKEIEVILNKCDNFTLDVALMIIRLGGGYILMDNFEKFKGGGHLDIAEELINKGGYFLFTKNITKFTEITNYERIIKILLWQDMGSISIPELFKVFPGINHLQVAEILMDTPNKRTGIIHHLNLFPGLDQVNLIEDFIKYNAIPAVSNNLEKFTEIDPKIYHPKIMDELIQRREFLNATINLEKFTEIDPKIYHPQIYKGIRELGDWDTLVKYSEKFTEIDPKMQQFLKRVKRSKSDTKIVSWYPEIQGVIQGFDDIFDFYIKHKQKAIIPLMQKILIAKEIGVKTNFQGITDLLDHSWMTDKNLTEIKVQVITTFTKLLDLIDAPAKEKLLKELENTLKQIKSFDDSSIEKVQLRFVNIIESYFDVVYDKKVKQRFVSELGLKKVDHLEAILSQNPEILEGFKMEQATSINKSQFREILSHAIAKPGVSLDLINFGKNKTWIENRNIRGKNINLWTERNEKKYDIGETLSQSDKSKEIDHFFVIANLKLELLGLIPQKDVGSLMNYFNTEIKKKKELLLKESKMKSEEFDNLYNDLELQIESIHNLFKETKSKEITSLTIYRETDPVKVLMMGNWVDGSCLSFYSSVGNYWSTATNTLDINKGVFYIKNQDGDIIGRVLTAIDNRGKILRFGSYKKGNISLDIDAYFDQYIKELSQKIGLGINGNINKVELLNGEKWYQDPVERIL